MLYLSAKLYKKNWLRAGRKFLPRNRAKKMKIQRRCAENDGDENDEKILLIDHALCQNGVLAKEYIIPLRIIKEVMEPSRFPTK